MFKKQYITGAFLAVISLFSSCTNLDEEIFSSIPEKDFYKTESEFLAAMVPIYSSMRTLTEHSNWWDLEETTDVCVTPVKNHGLWYDGGIYIRLHQHSWMEEDAHLNLEENIENQTEYEFWNGSGWIKGNETAATPLFNDISGELSIAYHPEFKKWILLYFNSTRYDISFRTADHIIGEWSKPQKLVDGWQYSQLYGSYIHPISLKGNILYFIMSMWLPYNTYLMSAELKCNP